MGSHEILLPTLKFSIHLKLDIIWQQKPTLNWLNLKIILVRTTTRSYITGSFLLFRLHFQHSKPINNLSMKFKLQLFVTWPKTWPRNALCFYNLSWNLRRKWEWIDIMAWNFNIVLFLKIFNNHKLHTNFICFFTHMK